MFADYTRNTIVGTQQQYDSVFSQALDEFGVTTRDDSKSILKSFDRNAQRAANIDAALGKFLSSFYEQCESDILLKGHVLKRLETQSEKVAQQTASVTSVEDILLALPTTDAPKLEVAIFKVRALRLDRSSALTNVLGSL